MKMMMITLDASDGMDRKNGEGGELLDIYVCIYMCIYITAFALFTLELLVCATYCRLMGLVAYII